MSKTGYIYKIESPSGNVMENKKYLSDGIDKHTFH
jgi:hypothetical protein